MTEGSPSARPGRIYTRTGDTGQTGLLGPHRVPKDHPRVEAYGAVDELNAWLGWAEAALEHGPDAVRALAEPLGRVQSLLFVAGAELAADPSSASSARLPRIRPTDVQQLEAWIDAAEDELPPLRHFVLPGGTPAAAALHVARAVARRAERRVVALAAREPVSRELLAFFNRLSDWLFVLARLANVRAGRAERPWEPSSDS